MSTYSENRRFCDARLDLAADEIISIVLAATMLICTMSIGIRIQIILHHQTKLIAKLKWLYTSSVISYTTYLISAISMPLVCHSSQSNGNHRAMIPILFGLISYFTMLLNLLATLLIRLYHTFDQSMYRIPQITRYIINGLFTFTVILFVIGITFYIGAIAQTDETRQRNIVGVTVLFSSAGFITYIITAAYIVIIFARNMLKLTKLRASSSKNVLNLNKTQNKLINNISRYVSLFSFALFFTFLAMLTPYFVNLVPNLFEGRYINLILIFGTIDGMVNIVCLALQNKFATKFYKEHCEWIECCWKSCFKKVIKQALYERRQMEVEIEMDDDNGNDEEHSSEKDQFELN